MVVLWPLLAEIPSVDYWNIVLPSGTPIGRFVDGSSNDRRYYHTDHLGSTRAVTDGSRQVVERRDHYPFGLQMPGRTLAQGPQADEDYTGHALDAETGMHYAGARFYMSALGRWGTADPILDEKGPGALLQQDPRLLTMSAYNYTFNDPTNLLDPDGFAPEGCCRRRQGLKKMALGTVGFAGSVAGMAFPEPISTAAGIVTAGPNLVLIGSGAMDVIVGDNEGSDEIPSYDGVGDIVTRDTDYEEAGQLFDIAIGFGTPTDKLGQLFGMPGKVAHGISVLGSIESGIDFTQENTEMLEGTVFENSEEGTEGGTQAPDHRTRDDRLDSGTTISPELRDDNR